MPLMQFHIHNTDRPYSYFYRPTKTPFRSFRRSETITHYHAHVDQYRNNGDVFQFRDLNERVPNAPSYGHGHGHNHGGGHQVPHLGAESMVHQHAQGNIYVNGPYLSGRDVGHEEDRRHQYWNQCNEHDGGERHGRRPSCYERERCEEDTRRRPYFIEPDRRRESFFDGRRESRGIAPFHSREIRSLERELRGLRYRAEDLRLTRTALERSIGRYYASYDERRQLFVVSQELDRVRGRIERRESALDRLREEW